MRFSTLLRDGLEARSFTATVYVYLLGLVIFLPIALAIHYTVGEPSATFVSATLATLIALIGRGICYLNIHRGQLDGGTQSSITDNAAQKSRSESSRGVLTDAPSRGEKRQSKEPRRIKCTRCDGTGKTSFSTSNPSCSDDPGEHFHDCMTCDGTGFIDQA